MANLIAALLPFVAAALSTLRLACAAPVAHSHYNASSRQRYCDAFSGGSFTYSPLYLPHGVGLLHKPPRLDERALDMHTYLPVLHTSMGGILAGRGIPFYYLALGCSDMYIRAGRTLVAHNRVHALLRLLHDDAPRTAAALNADCAKKINSTGRPAIVSVRTLALATPDVEVPQAFARFSGSACLNLRVYRELLAQGFDTLVLNYEAPGHSVNSEPNTNEWKTEIMHRSRTMYDRSHALCAPQPRADGKCAHCGNRTPATTLVCERHESELYYVRRYKELRGALMRASSTM